MLEVRLRDAAPRRVDLVDAGALRECDQEFPTSDTPLQTLTVFRSGSTQRANTFSWYSGDDNLAEMEALLSAFLAAHFDPPPGGSKS